MTIVRRQHKLQPVSFLLRNVRAPNHRAATAQLLTASRGYGAGQGTHPGTLTRESVIHTRGTRSNSTHQCVTLLVCEIGRQTRSDGLLEHLLVSLTSRVVHLCSQADGLQRRRERRRRREFLVHLWLGRGLEWDGRYWQCR